MNALTCEMCGSTNLIKEDGVFVCQSCGTKYSVEEAKKMMVEGIVDVKGTVKVDISDELKNLYEVARRAKDTDNTENALKYYDMILVKDPSSWEANFYVIYYKAMNCKIAGIESAGTSLMNSITSILKLVKDNVNEADQENVLKEITIRYNYISVLLYTASKNHYEDTDESIKYKYLQEYVDNTFAAMGAMYTLGDSLIKTFGDKYGTIAAEAWKGGIDIHKKIAGILDNVEGNKDMIKGYVDKINKYDNSYTMPYIKSNSSSNTSSNSSSTSSDGCYIATSVYGSYDCPEVWVLRRFRDFVLYENWYGRTFIKMYYSVSPIIVKIFGNKEWFRSLFKKPLDMLVEKLQENGYKSTPYNDRNY